MVCSSLKDAVSGIAALILYKFTVSGQKVNPARVKKMVFGAVARKKTAGWSFFAQSALRSALLDTGMTIHELSTALLTENVSNPQRLTDTGSALNVSALQAALLHRDVRRE